MRVTEVDDLDQGDAGRLSFGLFYPPVPWQWVGRFWKWVAHVPCCLGWFSVSKKIVVRTVDSSFGDGLYHPEKPQY